MADVFEANGSFRRIMWVQTDD
jgi:hypothetical protein